MITSKQKYVNVSNTLSMLVILVGVMVLIGWMANINFLKSISPNWVSMKASTAISFILGGTIIILLKKKHGKPKLAFFLAAVVMLIALLTLLQYFLKTDFNIDKYFFNDYHTQGINASSERQSPVSAFCFFIFSLTIINAYNKETPPLFLQYGNLLVLMVAFVNLLGYILNNSSFFTLKGASNIAFHTAIAFILLTIAGLQLYAAESFFKLFTSRRYTNIILRKILPGFILIALFLSWVHWQSEQASLYDLNPGFVLLILILIIIFSIQLTGIALSLAKKEDEHKLAEYQILKANINLEMAEKQAKLGNWEYNTGTMESKWSKQMFRIFEMDLNRSVPEYETYMQHIHPEDVLKVRQFYEDMLQQKGDQQQIQFRTNPSIIPLKYLTSAWYIQEKNADGSIQIFGTLQDISDSVLTQKKLSASEARAKLVYDHSSIIIWEEDFSHTYNFLQEFMPEHGARLEYFLLNNIEILKKAAGLVKITAVNKTGLQYYGAKNVEELITFLPDWFVEESWPVFANELHMMMNGQLQYENEIVVMSPRGNKQDLLFNYSIPPQYAGTLEKVIVTFIDISPLKEAQNKLVKSEIKYRSLIEQASDGIAITDADGRFLEVNDSFCKMLGYECSEFEQMRLVDILPTEDVYTNPIRIDKLIEGMNRIYERRMRRKDGTVFHVEVNTKMAADGTFIGFMRDITKRKETAQLILNERDLSESLINSLPGVFYFYDERGKFLKWNKNFENVTGYSAAEISVMHPSDFFPEDEKEVLTKKINSVFEKGEDSLEANFLTKQGKKLPYFFTGRSLIQNGEPFLLGVGIDVIKRKAAEEALGASEEKFQSLVEQASDAIIITDAHLNFMEINTAATKLLGYSKKELLTMNARAITEISIKEFNAGAVRLTQGAHMIQERIFKRKNGSLVPVEISAGLMKDGSFMAIVRDISERRRTQEQVKKSNNELKLLTAHLLSVREEERKRIGREIHDELGQQMTAIKMDVAWIDKKIPAEETLLKTKLKNIIELLDGSNASVRRIISELRPGALDEFGLMNALEWHGKQFTGSSNVPVIIKASHEQIRVPEIIATCIYRLYQEALTNVARYANATHVHVSINFGNASIEVIIADDGVGFSTEKISRTSFGILGMKERVQSLNGIFKMQSEKAKGTRIEVSLPLKN